MAIEYGWQEGAGRRLPPGGFAVAGETQARGVENTARADP